MAEGLDEAASAFQTDIGGAPPAERSRDSGGRFAARPEAMFEPRPLEGDPLTGDLSDGGADARLVAAEQRIADGRAEEGDAEALRASANDNQQVGNDNEPPEDGKPKPEEEDEDAPRYEVTVDGERMEVSLPEALKGYIREQTFHQRMSKVAEARQAIEQEAANVVQARDVYSQRLQFIERTLAELMPPQPDWDREFAADPRAAHEKQKAYAAIYGKIGWAQQEQQRVAQEAAQEYDRNSQRYAVDQFRSFVSEANIRDEKTLNAEMSTMRDYAKSLGFSEGEIATVYDKRMLLVLRDAARYRQMTANRPKAVQPGQGKTLAPGAATPIGNAPRRSLDEAMQKLARTGRTEDAAQVFQRLIR